MTIPTDDDIELARAYSVVRYRSLEAKRDKREIARLILRRFTDRYVAPVLARGNVKHGFATMAIACLMIEALESFRQGWSESKGRSKMAFRAFLEAHEDFAELRNHAEEFYFNVRCGILHQAEVTGGWRILRRGVLFDSRSRAINATVFMRRLSRALKRYCRELDAAGWDDNIWFRCRTKMDALCRNCAPRYLPER